ncbi:MAG: hypothetical protein JXB39_09650 [Deltaproteobacteria bacterium]|nr:hypothetical protein [Deltaproteobacteria bacterium]
MADPNVSSIPSLYKRWRSGEGEAGQEMAQRFSDWYYALTASRLGEQAGRDPLQRSCERFSQEILAISSANELVEWAHGVVVSEMERAGSRIRGGDFPSTLTQRRPPSEILAGAWKDLPRESLALLSHAYDASYSMDQIVQEAEGMGGYPVAVLQARLDLKRWLRDACGVPFVVVPDTPHLDSAPLPVYEAGRMTNPKEESRFERWLLTREDQCRDIAEFAPFALSIRSGSLARSAPPAAPESAPPRRPASPPPARPAAGAAPRPASPPMRETAPTFPERRRSPILLFGGLAFVVLVGILLVLLIALRS